MSAWFHVTNADELASPALLVYPDRIRENIRRMIALAGGADRLCPHVKTHKLAEVVQLHLEEGVTRFKCATLAEAAMVAGCGASSILVALQPVGPAIRRLLELVRGYPLIEWGVLADHEATLSALSQAATSAQCSIGVVLDLDVGMHRTGIAPDDQAFRLYQSIVSRPGLRPGGLHAYDGHIRESNSAARAQACEAAYQPVAELRHRLTRSGLTVPQVIAGATPTLSIHARRENVRCSPGTCVLWDAGYGAAYPELGFLPAAVLLARVISKPLADRLCLDLGHKAVASEMPQPRVQFPDLPDAVPLMHSEEHLVLESRAGAHLPLGTVLYGIPWHICPTVALHAEVTVVAAGRAEGRWRVIARDRFLPTQGNGP